MHDGIPAEVLQHAPPLDDEALHALFDHADAHLSDDVLPEPASRARSWEPTTEQEAEWCMAKASAASREMDRVAELAADYHQQIEAWAADASRGARNTAGFFRQKLEGYLRRRHDADAKLRTVRLPSGTLRVSVPKSGKVVVVDENRLMVWLLKNAEKVPADDVIKRPDPSVLVSELRKHVKAVPGTDGTWLATIPGHEAAGAPPGVDVLPPAEPTYTVNPI